jgi:hypothetical protein
MVGEKSGKPPFGAKSAFVRSLDRSLSAAEVVALAEKRGLRLTAAFVYNIRSSSARSSKQRGPTKSRGRAARVAHTSGSPESQLRAAIAQIGLARAREILQEVEDTFAGLQG